MLSDSLRQLVDYIKENISKGYTVESLKWALLNQGYSRTLVLNAISTANKEIATTLPKLKEKPTINYELYDQEDKLLAKAKKGKSFIKKFFEDIFG
jgi:hypothetical protein